MIIIKPVSISELRNAALLLSPCFPYSPHSKIHFRYFKSIKKPSLVVYGSRDEYAWGDVDRVVSILKSYQPKLSYKVIKGGDHSFKGYERKLAEIVTDWLS